MCFLTGIEFDFMKSEYFLKKYFPEIKFFFKKIRMAKSHFGITFIS